MVGAIIGLLATSFVLFGVLRLVTVINLSCNTCSFVALFGFRYYFD